MIFPILDVEETEEQELPVAKEWAFDFATGDFLLKDGKMYLVEREEAVAIWVKKALLIQRGRFEMYSEDYGSELEDLIGSGYSLSALELEAKRLVQECVEINPYVVETKDYEVSLDNDVLNITFTLITVYGEVKISV